MIETLMMLGLGIGLGAGWTRALYWRRQAKAGTAHAQASAAAAAASNAVLQDAVEQLGRAGQLIDHYGGLAGQLASGRAPAVPPRRD